MSAYNFLKLFFYQFFKYLNSVTCSTFSDVVCNDPNVQSILDREVSSDSADVYFIRSGSVTSESSVVTMTLLEGSEASCPYCRERMGTTMPVGQPAITTQDLSSRALSVSRRSSR